MRTSSPPRVEPADFGLRTVPNTRAPRSAGNCAISRPMPDETPVTNAILFFSWVCIYTIWFGFFFEGIQGLFVFVQGQRRSFEIGKNGGPAFFTESFDRGTLGGLPGRCQLFNLLSTFGRDREFHTIPPSASDGLHKAVPLQP